MLDPQKIDFRKIGFHAGLEVHHQIQSDRKLFCNCPPRLEKDPRDSDYSFYRYFRPVLGEMGDFDPGMLVEFEKGYRVTYLACEGNTCTYEMDETPPFFPDMKAVEEGFVLAFYFNCSALAEEIVVCRKQYLDGSITTGFQRTFIIGRDGWVPVNGKSVRISNVHIEEDAARRVGWLDTASREVCFNLDRLGVPLTEVITDHRDVDNPEELVELAKQIGRVLRVSGVGKRGIGAARQDVNISIAGGDRVEIKGVQDLSAFDRLCRREVVRQNALIEIRDEMKSRGLENADFEHTYIDVSQLFHLNVGESAFAVVFPRMKGILGTEVQPGKDFGEEIFEKSMLITGIPREHHFHSDELMENAVRKRSEHRCQLPIDTKKYQKICSLIESERMNSFVLVAGPERRAMHALKKIVERVKLALIGVPQETRRLLPNGNSEFLRVIHGKERIYPDTDTPPIPVSEELIQKCREKVGKRPWETSKQLFERYRLRQNQVDLLIRDQKTQNFMKYVEELRLGPQIAYRLLVELPRYYRRKGLVIKEDVTDKLAAEISTNRVTLAQGERVLRILLSDPSLTIKNIKDKFSLHRVAERRIDDIVHEQIRAVDLKRVRSDRKYRTRMLPRIVGRVLKASDYSVEGKKVLERVNALIDG